MMSLTFGLFTPVSDSGPQGPLVNLYRQCDINYITIMNTSNLILLSMESKIKGLRCLVFFVKI